MKIKRLTEDKDLLIKELEKQYNSADAQPDSIDDNYKDIKPSKYDEGTGTFYSDEEMAKKKFESKLIPYKKKQKEPEKSIDEMVALFEKNREEVTTAKKKGVGIIDQNDISKWHSGL